LIYGAEIARCFGSDATTSAIESVWKRQVRPGVKSITETLNQSGDPKDLALMDTLWTAGKGTKGRPFGVSELFAQHVFLLSTNSHEASVGTLSLLMMSLAEVARCFGSDANAKSIVNVWGRQVRTAAQKITDTLKQGGDPKDIEVNVLWAVGRANNGRRFRDSSLFTQHVVFLISEELGIFSGSRIDVRYRDRQVLWHQLHEDWSQRPLSTGHQTQRQSYSGCSCSR
jgi:hypothetical protein